MFVAVQVAVARQQGRPSWGLRRRRACQQVPGCQPEPRCRRLLSVGTVTVAPGAGHSVAPSCSRRSPAAAGGGPGLWSPGASGSGEGRPRPGGGGPGRRPPAAGVTQTSHWQEPPAGLPRRPGPAAPSRLVRPQGSEPAASVAPPESRVSLNQSHWQAPRLS